MKKPLERLVKPIGRAGAGLKPVRMRKPLPSLQPGADPLEDLAPSGDAGADSAAELDAIQAGFRDRARQEAERFKNATDSAYYFCVVFESGDQASAFLAGVGHPRQAGDLFIDGRELADRLGIDLPKADIRYNTSSKIDAKLKRLAR